MGAIGIVIFCVAVSIFLAFWDLSENGVSFFDALKQSPLSQSSAWVAGPISFCFSRWLKKVSSDTLKELDILLNESFSEKNEA